MESMLNQERVNPLNDSISNFLGRTDSNLSSMVKEEISFDGILETENKNITVSAKELCSDINAPSSQNKSVEHEDFSLNKLDENKTSLQPEKTKQDDYTMKQLLQETESELLSATNDYNTINPLEFSSELDCSDEFVNINLLDNPEFLKSFTTNSNNALSLKHNNATPVNKTEDSDIEILENIDNTKITKEKKDYINQNADSKSFEQKTENKDQLISCDTDIENKLLWNDVFEDSVNMIAQSEKPLTLEDIKDTGYTGLQLYKCGYEKCNFAASTATLLKTHVKECNYGTEDKNLYCVHCNKRFIKIGFLLEHIKIHGLKRFGCSLCTMRYAGAFQAIAHMKAKHKIPNTKVVPADPTNPSANGLFVVHAVVSYKQFFKIYIFYL